MIEHQTLAQFLAEWSADQEQRAAVARAVTAIADACGAIAEIIALGPLAGRPGARFCADAGGEGGGSEDPGSENLGSEAGDGERADDAGPVGVEQWASALLSQELVAAPVACMASEQLDLPSGFDIQAPLCVALSPLDGSPNVDTNVAVGTIFSILPMTCSECQPSRTCFVRSGRRQLAAGYVIYGPMTALVLTLGAGTHVFTLNPDTGVFCLTGPGLKMPEDTNEFAINTSNFRRWDGHIRGYIDDCLKGVDCPHGKNYHLRWIESLVAECHRIMMRGGIFLYPGDRRPEHQTGRLRLTFECNPLAFLVEQAGGAATTGHENILDIAPTDIHQRVPLIFGSLNEVRLLEHYYREAHPYQERSPLFGNRGLFRAS
jgi:fructose-1,6-bisphosphatase I